VTALEVVTDSEMETDDELNRGFIDC